MKWLVLLAAVPSCLIAWIAVPPVRRWATRWGLVDQPDARKNHQQSTPLGGGFSIWLGVVLTFVVGMLVVQNMTACHGQGTGASNTPAPSSSRGTGIGSEIQALSTDVVEFIAPHFSGIVAKGGKLWTLLAAATVMMLLGLADDQWHLDWRLRLLVQTLVASFVVWQGWRMSLFIDVPAFTFVLSVIWIVGIVNSFNMLDNMDGLSAGVAMIAASMLAIVMLTAPDPQTHQPQLFVAGFLAVLVGALAGFLWYNSPPASIFMGDAGSYFIGFLLATSTLMATFAGGNLPRYAILAPLCVLAVPIYDSLTVLTIRFRAGRSPFVADRSHFSHRLVELGLSQRQAVWTIYLLTGACGLGALLLHEVDGFGACVVLLMVATLLVVIAVLETVGRRQ